MSLTPLYDDMYKTSDFWTELSPHQIWEKVWSCFVDCIPKHAYDILRKDRTYDIKVWPNDWPVYGEGE